MKKKTCPVGANSNVLKRQIIRPSPSLSSTSQNTTICERAAAILAALPQYQELGQLGPVGSLCIKTKAWRSISETSERVAFRNMLGPPHVIVSVKENAQESKNVNQHQQHCLSNLDSEDSKDSKASVHNVYSASEAAPRARLHEDPPKGHTHTHCAICDWNCYTVTQLLHFKKDWQCKLRYISCVVIMNYHTELWSFHERHMKSERIWVDCQIATIAPQTSWNAQLSWPRNTTKTDQKG